MRFRTLLCLVLAAGLLASCLAHSLGLDPEPYRDKPGFPGSAEAGKFEMSLLKEANRARAEQGYKPLEWDQALADLALAHATDMAKREAVDHAGFETRYKLSGFRLCVENVAMTRGDPARVVALWMNSPGHRANLLHPETNRVGVARAGWYVAWFSCR